MLTTLPLLIMIPVVFSPTLGDDRVSWDRMIVGIRKGDGESRALAVSLGKAIDSPVMEFATNPVCCLWVEKWAPTGSGSCFVLVLQDHGGVLLYSDNKAFKNAVNWVSAQMVVNGRRRRLPKGVVTNLPALTFKETAAKHDARAQGGAAARARK